MVIYFFPDVHLFENRGQDGPQLPGLPTPPPFGKHYEVVGIHVQGD